MGAGRASTIIYSGPAPVPLTQWLTQVKRQSITNDRVDQTAIAGSLKSLVISRDLIARFGPAVNAGRAMLLYGAPGDGKTSIAQAIAQSFKQPVWIPYAIEVDGEIVKISIRQSITSFQPRPKLRTKPRPPLRDRWLRQTIVAGCAAHDQ